MPFVQIITSGLYQPHKLTLSGSWANNEYHAIYSEGIIRSYSDVDFISRGNISADDISSIKRDVLDIAKKYKLCIKDVSVRPESEIIDMWKTSEAISNSQRFILFWLLIGVAEICVEYKQQQAFLKRCYLLNKLFLNIWRDIGLVSGKIIRTYHDIKIFMSRSVPADIGDVAYLIKLGAGNHGNQWSDIQTDYIFMTCRTLCGILKEEWERKIAFNTIVRILNIEKCEARQLGYDIIRDAYHLSNKSYEWGSAVNRLKNKLLL